MTTLAERDTFTLTRRCWSRSDLEKLKRMYGYIPVARIAHALNRSENAVRSKASELNLSTHKRLVHEDYRLWSSDEDEYITDNFHHMPLDVIADTLQRSQRAVLNRADYLELDTRYT